MLELPLARRPFFFALAFVFAPMAAAQTAAAPLATGTWTGQLDGDGPARAVTADIERCVEGFKLDLASSDGRFRASDVILRPSHGTVTFALSDTQRAQPFSCTVARRADGALDGTCTAGRLFRRTEYALTLRPPAQSTIGCSE